MLLSHIRSRLWLLIGIAAAVIFGTVWGNYRMIAERQQRVLNLFPQGVTIPVTVTRLRWLRTIDVWQFNAVQDEKPEAQVPEDAYERVSYDRPACTATAEAFQSNCPPAGKWVRFKVNRWVKINTLSTSGAASNRRDYPAFQPQGEGDCLSCTKGVYTEMLWADLLMPDGNQFSYLVPNEMIWLGMEKDKDYQVDVIDAKADWTTLRRIEAR